MKFSSYLFVILFLSTSLGAQGQICGSDFADLSKIEKEATLLSLRKKRSPIGKSGNMDSVAVTVHIIESRSGNVDLTYEDIVAELKAVNNVFSSIGIYFFICGSPRYVNGAASYNFTSGTALNQREHVPNTINIYFADDVQEGEQGLCGFAQFPYFVSETSRYIMMNKACSTDGSTLSHEIGHFYGLFHTHETGFGLEYADGSNCQITGDRFCDTRADPNLSTPGLLSGCNYVGTVVDPQGDPYVPPVTNLMSYAPARCTRLFSEEQKAWMRAVHEDENAYLARRCDFYPDFSISTDLNTFTIRSDEDLIAEFEVDQTNLEKSYSVDLKISVAREPSEPGLLLYEQRLTLRPDQDLIPLRVELDFPIELSTGIYYLKGWIDANQEVIEITEDNNVANAVVEVDNSGLIDFTVFPNPVREKVKIFFRDASLIGGFQAGIFSYDGRLVREFEGYKSQEEYFNLLDLSDLTTGLYILRIDFDKRNATYTTKIFKQ